MRDEPQKLFQEVRQAGKRALAQNRPPKIPTHLYPAIKSAIDGLNHTTPGGQEIHAFWQLAESMRQCGEAMAKFGLAIDRAMNRGMNKRCYAEMKKRHRKWPLGTLVQARDWDGKTYTGRVSKHWRPGEGCEGPQVDFSPHTVDMGDANGRRSCHHIPFRKLRKVVE